MDYRQVHTKIKRGEFLPLYLFSGPDSYMQEKLLSFLLQQLKEKTGRAFYLERVDGREVALPDLLQRFRQVTIFSEGRVAWVSNAPYFSSSRGKGEGKIESPGKDSTAVKKEAENDLQSFARGGVDDLIIIFPVESVDRRKKLVKDMEKAGVLVEFPPPRGPALSKWIQAELGREGKAIDDAAVRLLVERVGEDLTRLRSELDKLIAYLGSDLQVSADVIRRLVPESRQGNIFKLVGAIGKKNAGEAYEHLSRMRQQNEHPLVMLTMIARQFRLLYQALLLEKEGLPARRIASELKVPPFAVEELLAQVKLYREVSLAKTLIQLKVLDQEIKTGQRDAAEALERLVLQLTTQHEIK